MIFIVSFSALIRKLQSFIEAYTHPFYQVVVNSYVTYLYYTDKHAIYRAEYSIICRDETAENWHIASGDE